MDDKLHERLDRLTQHVPKSKLLRMKLLVDDIANNRCRVREIINRLTQADNDKSRLWTMNQLVKKKFISDDQYFKLADILLDQLDLVKLTAVIKETTFRRGMNFLPRKTGDLINSLQEWLNELAETGTSVVRDKISSVLEELLRRKEMTRNVTMNSNKNIILCNYGNISAEEQVHVNTEGVICIINIALIIVLENTCKINK